MKYWNVKNRKNEGILDYQNFGIFMQTSSWCAPGGTLQKKYSTKPMKYQSDYL